MFTLFIETSNHKCDESEISGADRFGELRIVMHITNKQAIDPVKTLPLNNSKRRFKIRREKGVYNWRTYKKTTITRRVDNKCRSAILHAGLGLLYT